MERALRLYIIIWFGIELASRAGVGWIREEIEFLREICQGIGFTGVSELFIVESLLVYMFVCLVFTVVCFIILQLLL